MSNAALEKLVWVLIYSGLLLLCLGVFLMRGDTVARLGGAWSSARSTRPPAPC